MTEQANVPCPTRQVHLDFHTSPAIPDVGVEFDADRFAETFKRAQVNSVTVFAKCHHGHLYYNTARPERHPGLAAGFDLLAAQVEALHRASIRAPIYISVLCDEYAANTYPQWVARKADSAQVKWSKGVFDPGWQIMDMATDYQEFLAEQTREVLKLFHPVDGIFFDMCWDQPSTTAPFLAGMRKANLNPENAEDRDRHAHSIALQYMRRFHGMVKDANPAAGVFFNGRKHANLPEEIAFQEQVEIEALPTGGWGYGYFPRHVRFARRFGKPYLGMTARFHKAWADFGGLKPLPALEYETSQMLAHGAACSVGDQLHPRGTLDAAAYDLIGAAYARVAAREEWTAGAVPVTEIGLVQTAAPEATEGAVRVLTQLKHQFDVIDLVESSISKYRLLILPDAIALDDAGVQLLQGYLSRGGKVLASGTSGLSPDGSKALLPELGVAAAGMSPFTTTYMRFAENASPDAGKTDHVVYDRGVRVAVAGGGKAVAGVVEPYFERAWDHFSSHKQTPGDRLSPYAAAVTTAATAYVSFPVFGAVVRHGNAVYRQLVGDLIDHLLPDPLLRVKAYTGTEATVARQPARGDRTIVHLLHYAPERRAKDLDLIEDVVPIHDVGVSLKLQAAPRWAYLAPERTPLKFGHADGRVDVVVPEVRGHAMVVFE